MKCVRRVLAWLAVRREMAEAEASLVRQIKQEVKALEREMKQRVTDFMIDDNTLGRRIN